MNKKAEIGIIGILLIIGVLVGGYFLLTNNNKNTGELQSTSGDVIRTVPINGGGSFTVTYSSNISGQWGAIIEDSLVGTNCHFSNNKQTYKSVMLGNGPTSQTVSVSGHNCIFSAEGNFNIISSTNQGAITKFGTQTVI